MKILLLNQTFYPDVVSTAQHLKDLAVGLAKKGHEVTVLCSNRAYDDVQKRFSSRERWNPHSTCSRRFEPAPPQSKDFDYNDQLHSQSKDCGYGGGVHTQPEDCFYGIEIHRVGSLGLGKSAKWKRAADFASFFLAATFKTLRLPRHDVVIALTSPPLISLLGAQLAKRWRARFFYWVMDLNPDEAIAAGWLRPNSFAAKVLNRISNYSLRRAEKIIVLDRFMQERIEAKGIAANKIEIIPPWSHDDEVKLNLAGRAEFRKEHGLENKFVVMYSGNHSPCHPLNTLLDAASQFTPHSSLPTPPPGSTGAPPVPFGDSPKDPSLPHCPSSLDSSIVFCFVGGGSEWRKIRDSISAKTQPEGLRLPENRNSQPEGLRLRNILCLPYQPLDKLSASLSAADLHVVVMGDPFVGTIHPCKIYNVLNIGAPVLYIGPASGHVPDIFRGQNSGENFYAANHGDAKTVAEKIRCARERKATLPTKEIQTIGERFAKDVWLPRFISIVERE